MAAMSRPVPVLPLLLLLAAAGRASALRNTRTSGGSASRDAGGLRAAARAVGSQAEAPELPAPPDRTSKFYDRCPARGAPRRHRLLAVQSRHRQPQASVLEACQIGTRIGYMTPSGYIASCCTAFAYCGGCGEIQNGRCSLCQGGYRLMGTMTYQKCTMCDDVPGWTDASGLTCADYEKLGLCKNSQAPLRNLPVRGMKPSDACCACGGGDVMETPWSYPASGTAFYPGQTVNAQPTPQTAFRYEVDPGCGLSQMNLTMNADGLISGETPQNATADGADIECQVTAVQDPLEGVKSAAPLSFKLQEISYGPRVLTFAFKDGLDAPTGKSTWPLNDGSLRYVFRLTSVSCVPEVPWIRVETDGTLHYVTGSQAVSGGISSPDSSGFDGGQCTLKGTMDDRELKMAFMVLRLHVWSKMEYKAAVHARNGRPIVPMLLTRPPPVGFQLHVDQATGRSYWYRHSASIWVPPALPPTVLDVQCTGVDGLRWSRRTGAVTIRGQPAFVLDPESGTISGTPAVDLPERLGQSSVAIICYVAAGGAAYDEVLQATAEVVLSDDNCYFPQITEGQVNAIVAEGSGTCRSRCRSRKDCSGYWEEGGRCWVQTSRTDNAMAKQVASLTARARCEEGATCIYVKASKARFIQGHYCPKGSFNDITIYSRSGNTVQDELFLAYGHNGACPMPGHSASTKHWVVRRASTSDYMDPDTGVTELRGEPVACLAEDIEREVFTHGVKSAPLTLTTSIYANMAMTSSEVTTHKTGLVADISLTAQSCELNLEDASMLVGTYPSKAQHSLDPCECFGKAYRDTSPVSEASRAAAGSPSDLKYNMFSPPPMLLFEGPYVCEHEGVLPNGQKNEIDEDDCRSECFAAGSICRFFLYVPELRFCILLSQCSRLGHTGLEMNQRLFGVFPPGEYCRIADPEACWTSRMRRDLVEGQFEGSPMASGAATGPSDAGGTDNCAFQEQLAQCDAMQLLTTEQHGKCSRCAYFPASSTAAAGLSKVPAPATFRPGSQVVLTCSANSRLLNTKTGHGLNRAILTCVDGAWQDAGFMEGISGTSNAGRAIQVLERVPLADEQVYSDKSVKFTSLGDFVARNLLYIRAADADKSVAAKTVMWTFETPVPVIVYLDFWGGDAHTTGGCSEWLKAANSGWVKTLMRGSSFSNTGTSSTAGAKGPGVVYRQDFPAGTVLIYGNANCGTGNFLVFVETIDMADDESKRDPLSRLVCSECIQLAQPEYANLLQNSAPEVYYITRRTALYHYGEVSSGCRAASRATPAPLSTEQPDSCLASAAVGSKATVNRDCSELWILDTKKRVVSVSTNACLDNTATMRSCSDCESRIFFGARKCVWRFDSSSQLRTEEGQCLRNNAGTLSVQDCSQSGEPQEKWYFDGGDCRYKMALKSTDIPLMWRFTAGEGAMYGAEMEVKAVQALATAKTSIAPMAHGNCKVMLQASLSAADEEAVKTISLMTPSGETSKVEYTRSMVWKIDSGAYFACSPGGAGGVKAAAEARAQIDAKRAKISALRSGCDLVKKAEKNQDAAKGEWNNGWDGHQEARSAGKAIASIHSVHDNGKEDRLWAFAFTGPEVKTEPNGNPSISVSYASDTLNEGHWTGWDAAYNLECNNGQVLTGQISYHDNGKEDRVFKFECSPMNSAREGARSDWTGYTCWDCGWTYPPADEAETETKWIVGVSSYHDNGKEDRVFRWKTATFCKNKDPEIRALQGQIETLKQLLDGISKKEVTCASDFLMPISDIENLEAAYPAATDKNGNAITVSSKASTQCHMMHIGDPGPDPAYTMTAPQLVDLSRAMEYHGTEAEDPKDAPFHSASSDPTQAVKVGYFAHIENAATVWGIQCPKGSVVAAHEKLGSPHCVFVNAEAPDNVIETSLPASARCPLGFAMGGWWDLPGGFVRQSSSADGGPTSMTGFEFRCRLVPGLSRLCEDKEANCMEDEVVTGVKYIKETAVKYRCCKAPKTVGQLFASRHMADVRPWEGTYCPVSLDDTGRPRYKMCKHLGPNNNHHGSRPFQVTQYTAPPPGSSSSGDISVMCSPGQLLAQWRKISSSPAKYAYTCVHVHLSPQAADGLHPDGCTSSSSSSASCAAGSQALMGFVVRGSSGSVTGKTCCRITAGTQLSGQTAEAPSQNPGAADVRCGEGEVMHEWSPSGSRYSYKCQGFWQRLRLRGEAATLHWDKFSGAWTVSQAEAYQLRSPVRVGSGGAVSTMQHHPMACASGHLMKGWFMHHFGGGDVGGKVSFAVQCAKAKHGSTWTGSTSGGASSLSGLTSHNVDCSSRGGALQRWEWSSSGGFRYTCAPPAVALTSCAESHTSDVPASADVFALEGMPVICPRSAQVLQRMQLQRSGGRLRWLLRCCTTGFDAHKEVATVSSAALPHEVAPGDATQPGTAKLVGGSACEVWLAGERVAFTPKDVNVVAVDPLTGLAASARSFSRSQGGSLAAHLNALARHTVAIVVMKGAGLSGLNRQAVFALQRCGSTLTRAGSSTGYVLLGIVDGAKVVESTGDPVAVEAAIPPVFVAAPLVDFQASFVQEVSKSDPFPKEKPRKPELLEFSSKTPDYDEFCDPAVRSKGDQKVEMKPTDPDHPCYQTFNADQDTGGPITMFKVWQCNQRDIDREYLEGTAEVQRMQFDATSAKIENIFDWVELGVTLTAAAATAIPWGSFAVPGKAGASSGVLASLKGAMSSVASGLKKRFQKLGAKIRSPAMLKSLKASASSAGTKAAASTAARRAAMKTGKKATMKKAGENAHDVAMFGAEAGAALVRNSAASDGAGRHGVKAKAEPAETQAHKFVPAFVPPDQFGFSDATNREAFNTGGWKDCNPLQWGLSKIMCDIYCTEDAVRQGTASINSNIQASHQVMMVNLQRLLDYHSDKLMWGMGQLRDQLMPPLQEVGTLRSEVAAYRAEVQGYKTAAEAATAASAAAAAAAPSGGTASSAATAPGNTNMFIQELRALPSLLATNVSSGAALPSSTVSWHRSASATLVQRLDTLLEGLTPQNARDIAGRAHEMVKHFSAERDLRLQQSPRRQEATATEMAEEQASVLHKRIKAGRGRLRQISSAPKPMHFGGLMLRNDEVVVRWNQLADYFVKAHERHAVFVESRLRALDAAEAVVKGVDYYLACGLEQKELQESWRKQVQAEEHADEVLLEAWAASVSAQERLQMAVEQGLVDRVVESTVLNPQYTRTMQCGEFPAFVSSAHKAAVRSVDRSLWALVEQVLALDRITRYQEDMLRSKRLQGVAKVPLDRAVIAIYRAAAGAADPEEDSGRELAAKAVDALGPRACPAPANCQGMRLTNTSFGSWVALHPGELLRGSEPQVVVTACKNQTVQRHGAMKELIPVFYAYQHGLVSSAQVRQAEDELDDVVTPACVGSCRARLTVHLQPQRSIIAEAMLKLR